MLLSEGRLGAARRSVKVTEAFPPGFFDGLTMPGMTMERGDEVTVRPGQSGEWPAFVLVIKGEERGWVPKRYLDRRGNRTVAIRRYDTTTLSPSVGDILTVVEEDRESGWYWCEDKDGKLGWFAVNRASPVRD